MSLTADLCEFYLKVCLNPENLAWMRVSRNLSAEEIEDQYLAKKTYSGAAGLSSALNVEWDAFRGDGPLPWDTYPSGGTLINKNTLDAFKQCDKVGFCLNFGKP